MRKLSMKPFASRHRVAIIGNFERARGPAQDAILKTLEEPPPYAIILLLANSTEHTLATIQSRCQILYLRPVASEVITDTLLAQTNATNEQAGLIARLSGGRIGWALAAASQPEILDQRATALDMLENLLVQGRRERFAIADALGKDKPALQPLLDLWQTYLRDLLLLTLGSPVKPVNIDRTDALEQFARRLDPEAVRRAVDATARSMRLLETNTNPRLLLEVLMLDYPTG
jgi:DNA polymerase-3 subunit delta'